MLLVFGGVYTQFTCEGFSALPVFLCSFGERGKGWATPSLLESSIVSRSCSALCVPAEGNRGALLRGDWAVLDCPLAACKSSFSAISEDWTEERVFLASTHFLQLHSPKLFLQVYHKWRLTSSSGFSKKQNKTKEHAFSESMSGVCIETFFCAYLQKSKSLVKFMFTESESLEKTSQPKNLELLHSSRIQVGLRHS